MTNDPDGGQVLAGGVTNAGAVIRRGDLVERPAPRTAHALHAHLSALHGRGFDAAPAPVALLPGGRELLTFVPGTTALPPFPREALDEPVLTSVGRLLRRLHDTGTGIAPDPSADWPRDLADPEGGPLLCHNDVCVENVVLRDGRAAALIDFDMAAPGRPVWDFAMTARYWVPCCPRRRRPSRTRPVSTRRRGSACSPTRTASRRRNGPRCPPSWSRPTTCAGRSSPPAWPTATRSTPGCTPNAAAGHAGTTSTPG